MVRHRRLGQRRARAQAESAGGEVLRARLERGWSRREVSRVAGVSSDTPRRIEGGDPAVQLDTLCAVGEAVGIDVVVHTYPGREPPLRDSRQIEIVELLCRMANDAWQPRVELPAGEHGEAVDIGFMGAAEILATEVDRLLLEFQNRYRRNDQKRQWLAARHQRPVRLVMVLEDTARNRAAVAAHAAFIAKVLPAGTREILSALRSGRPLGQDGLLWIRRRSPPRPG